MKLSFVRLAFVALCWIGAVACADQVHVYQQTLVGGDTTRLSDLVQETGVTYLTQSAPAKSGHIFTYWSSSQPEPIGNRDRHGRAKEVASYKVYAEMTLTANYLPMSQDLDADGVADGYEIYWYGTTDIRPDSDTDGDGYTFAEELAAGTNPLLAEDSTFGAVVWDECDLLQYNPENLAPYVIRSEPEGGLFVTQSDYAKIGTTIVAPTVSKVNGFAYWMVNGVRQCDRHGRAKDAMSFTMTDKAIEVVAVAITDATERELAYWYGPESGVAAESDTDGDGYTFAEEIAAGTNPILAEDSTFGAVVWDEGDLVEYNPDALHAYVIRCEPEGELFATLSDRVRVGTALPIPSVNHGSSTFAYWIVNGVRQSDRHGRAKDAISVTMPNGPMEVVAVCIADANERELAYWYGAESGLTLDSDTDGDGYTFAEEIAAGTNPILSEDSTFGAIVWDDGETLEANLQPYEQMRGALVGGTYVEMFYSPVAGNESLTFGRGLRPVVTYINDDGLWDLVLVSDTATNVYLNVGTKGNPEFERLRSVVEVDSGVLEMNSTAKLATLDFDVQPVNALSATTWKETLLVSDTEGRIWYYTSSTPSPTTYTLNHKIWGGAHEGFAEGLQLAAVDWEDDGDLDCLCGTADGKLMLLRDPKVGRPTNVNAQAGVDNVLLTWDPNAQSRIRGYKVYRGDEVENVVGGGQWIAETSLPSYRDYPETIKGYDYAVSSVSRFYTAGNSTPTVTESPLSEPVHAELGRVSLHWTDAAAKIGEQVTVMLSIDNSANLSPEMTITIDYDETKLKWLKTVESGLFEGDKIAPGAGTLYVYVFDVIAAEPGETEVRVVSASMKGVGGQSGTAVPTVNVVLPEKNAIVTISAAEKVAYKLGDLTGDGVVDQADLRLLAKLKEGTGRKCTAQQLKAGDFNGNGRLDNADYQRLRAILQ